MSLSADGRYYHGKSKTDGYVFVEVEVADRLHQQWVLSHPKAPENLIHTMESLHTSASFWDLALLKGAHTLQYYICVELLTSHHYRVSNMDHGLLLWDYALQDVQLQQWLPTLSRLIQTSPDPFSGIYGLSERGTLPLWDAPPDVPIFHFPSHSLSFFMLLQITLLLLLSLPIAKAKMRE